jgi:hypothetical protein
MYAAAQMTLVNAAIVRLRERKSIDDAHHPGGHIDV